MQEESEKEFAFAEGDEEVDPTEASEDEEEEEEPAAGEEEM